MNKMNRLLNWSWMRKLWKKRENAEEEEGPFNRLPNELMKLILAKLELLDGDVDKLAQLRFVSTRWRAVVEDYCRMKKSLILVIGQNKVASENNISNTEKRFFGFANLKDFSRLFLWSAKTTKTLSKYLRSLLNLFPNIVQLSVHCFDLNQVDDLSLYINSLESLKQLDLIGHFVIVLPNLPSPLTKLSPTLSKLEHFSFDFAYIHDDDRNRQIYHFKPNCVRVYFNEPLAYHRVLHWKDINSAWLANVTHLRICLQFCVNEQDFARVVHFLSENAISLKHLSLDSLGMSLVLKLSVIHDLGKLIHLTSLELDNFAIPFPELKQEIAQHRITLISTVLTCKLSFPVHHQFNADQFTRGLSEIFPNLENLYLYIDPLGLEPVINYNPLQYQDEIEQHLDRFANLRKHRIRFYIDSDRRERVISYQALSRFWTN